MKQKYIPKSIVPSAHILARVNLSGPYEQDVYYLRLFLLSYANSKDTYNAYRRDVERFLQWLWYIKGQQLTEVNRETCLEYIAFFKAPPLHWIADKNYPRFEDESVLAFNQDWRPFVAKLGQYQPSASGLKAMLACLSTFFTFLIQEVYLSINPVQCLKQKKQIVGTQVSMQIKRRLTPSQWRHVIDVIQKKAGLNPSYQRHLFMLTIFYLLGVRISEVSCSDKRIVMMSSFYKDRNNCWWYEAHGKGNKIRSIAVPDALLDALLVYRKHLGIVGYPTPSETVYLFPKLRGIGGLGQRQIRSVIAESFELAEHSLRVKGRVDDADHLKSATVHWLRHTSISDDVQNRPGEHVRDDAGHANISTTSLYIDVLDEQRHASAKRKKLLPDDTSV
ncbi:tyrosine-type recombinase/integrase [Candidatus Comchoanobacter bicostacola]|uniref:Tyrosine-type recombinase/integrase n=1 Tax=Candidatus Comchoanobacter bicostacola TaxID=2919598 RepID=A0ABY5DI54_9GAMM|nr:tyrosine-type recombinase/integrase [Candidatus Comchoanobacter bicostacola]UTC24156.1 tyrosine-type recombinase/integrase [Candidatus Comchoanobacter bicostacola]